MGPLRDAANAVRLFLCGFLGLAGTPGVADTAPGADPRAARRALEERAARRPRCC
jgi:hypothetical protein